VSDKISRVEIAVIGVVTDIPFKVYRDEDYEDHEVVAISIPIIGEEFVDELEQDVTSAVTTAGLSLHNVERHEFLVLRFV
jgi:hypothetical protein